MYKNILFAVEFTHGKDYAEQIVNKLSEIFQANVYIINVVEDYPSSKVDQFITDKAKHEVREIAKKLSIPEINQIVEVGDPQIIIPEFIKKNNIDLLILGHHERKGLYHILGPVTQSLITHNKCAILILPLAGF